VESQGEIARGARLLGSGGTRIGTVDATFVDYLLVRTRGLVPVDLYVPRDALVDASPPRVDCTPREAHRRWHRPLKRAPHPDG
jgi:hypothetical protein